MAPGVSGERIGQGKKLELKQGHLEVCYLQITTLCLQDTRQMADNLQGNLV